MAARSTRAESQPLKVPRRSRRRSACACVSETVETSDGYRLITHRATADYEGLSGMGGADAMAIAPTLEAIAKDV